MSFIMRNDLIDRIILGYNCFKVLPSESNPRILVSGRGYCGIEADEMEKYLT